MNWEVSKAGKHAKAVVDPLTLCIYAQHEDGTRLLVGALVDYYNFGPKAMQDRFESVVESGVSYMSPCSNSTPVKRSKLTWGDLRRSIEKSFNCKIEGE